MDASITTSPTSAPATLPVLDDAGYAALARSTGVVLVDFTAAWCGPCRALEPVLHQLDATYRGRVRIVSVDVDRSPMLAQRLRVVSMPTLVLLRDGQEVGRIVGARALRFLAGALDRALAGEVAITGP